jgi:hypothetical protein
LRRAYILAYLPILAAPLILLAPVYLRGQALFWGTPLLQFVPWWSYALQALSNGHLPLWNPYVGMGAPLMANYQSALFYPPTWLYFLLGSLGGAAWMAWGQAPVVAIHLFWSGLGMAMLARRLGLGGLAQGVGGLSYGLSGYLVSRAGFLSINAAAAWMPWVLLCLTVVLEAGQPGTKRRSFILLVVCLAFQLLSGHAQTTWYTGLLAGLWAAFFWIRFWRAGQRSQVFQTAARLALAFALALGLAAIQLLPTAEYLSQSQRSTAVDFDYALNYSFWPWHLLTFLAPGLFGSPATGDYWGFANYWEDAVYIGVLPLLLALGTLLANLRRKPALHPAAIGLTPGFAWFLWSIVGISMILALGSFTAIYPWLYRHVPTFNMFQAPARWMLWAVFALSLLAAIGAERWRRPEKRALYWTRLGTAGAFSILLGAGLGWLLLGEVSPTFVRATALMGFWCLGAGILSLLAPPASLEQTELGLPAALPGDQYPLTRWRACVVLWIMLDLLVAGWGLNPGGPLALYGPSPTSESIRDLASGGRLFIPDPQEYWLKYVRFLRFDTFDPGEDWWALRAAQLPNTNLLDLLPMVNNFDPFVPGRFTEWLTMMAQATPEVYDELLRLMNVGVVETLQRAQPYGIQFSPIEESARLRWVPCQWVTHGEAEARKLILSDQVDFNTQVLIEESESGTPTGINCEMPVQAALAKAQELTLTIQDDNPNRLLIYLDAPGAGWLVLSDVWYPGWHAWVDGHPATILRANYLFRAVKVEPGKQQVIFVYQPLSFRLGLVLSLLSCVVVAILVYRSWRLRLD